jgi:lysozyme family protein
VTDAIVLAQLWEVGVALQNAFDNAVATNDPRAPEIKKELEAASVAYKKGVFQVTSATIGSLEDAKKWLTIFKKKVQDWPFGIIDAPFKHETPNRDNDAKVPVIIAPNGPRPVSGKALTNRDQEYLQLWNSMTINPSWKAKAVAIAEKIIANQSRYMAVVSASQIPWWFVAIVHSMECSLRFDQHLHNGDPLTARTVRIPPNLPASGFPPFTWEDSASDALEHDDIDSVTDWSLPNILFLWHRYNGINNEYKQRGIPTPYLWSGTQHYKKGKYVEDGVFSDQAVSQQVGAATLLRTLIDLNAVILDQKAVQSNVLAAVGSASALTPAPIREGMASVKAELAYPGGLSENGGKGTGTKLGVRRLQEWLSLHNCSTPIDGDFGASTRAQLEKFQSRNGRAASGVLDEDTWTLLTAPLHRALSKNGLSASTTLQETTARIAAQHIAQGPREIGGENRGPWVRLYMDGQEGDNQLWCAGFVCFIVAQAARDLDVPLPFKRQVGVDQLVADAKKDGRFVDDKSVKNPKMRASKIPAGTIYVFRETADNWVHCGIVKSVHEDTFDTFEGNTSGNGSSNGTVAIEGNRSFAKKDFITLI